MRTQHINQAMTKLKRLPPERVTEVMDFIDFLSERENDQAMTHVAKAVSEPLLGALWDNEADAEYDRL